MDSEGLSLMLIYFFGSRVGSCLLRPIAMRGRRITVAVCSFCRKSSTGKVQIRFGRRQGLCEECFAHLSCKLCDMSYTCMIVFFIHTWSLLSLYIFWIEYFLCDRRGFTVSYSVVHSREVFSVLLLGSMYCFAWCFADSLLPHVLHRFFVRLFVSGPLYK